MSLKGKDFRKNLTQPWLIKSTQFTIVLTTDEKHFITVELGFTVVNGKKHIYPVTRELHPSNKPKLEFLGTIDAKGQDLLAKAVDVMKRFGNYFKFCKNCQNFCDKYVEAIGLKKAKSLTEDDMSAIAAILTGILVFFLFLFTLVKSLIRNERRKTQWNIWHCSSLFSVFCELSVRRSKDCLFIIFHCLRTATNF